MAAKCPICKKTQMRFGGMAALDGTYCGKCYDRALKKGMPDDKISKLKLSEIAEYLESVDKKDTRKWIQNINQQRKQTKQNRETRLPYLEKFRESLRDFYTETDDENSMLQEYATQIFWHVNRLRKNRLTERGITVTEDTKHETIDYVEDYMEKSDFDGKYEIRRIRETIDGTVTFSRGGTPVYDSKKYNIGKYIIHDVHVTDNDDIICPSCGAASGRSNLIDGCDYCGARFTVQDLSGRIAEYRTYNDIDTSSSKFLYGEKGTKAGTIISAIVLFALGLWTGIIGSVLSAIVFLILSPVLGYLAYSFIFKMAIVFFNIDRANYQSTKEYERDEERRNREIIEKIREYDPLFSAEELYAEAENIVAAHYYADVPVQVSAFWNEDNESGIDAVLERNKDVINADILSAGITDYSVKNGMQHVKLSMEVEVLRDNQKKADTSAQKLRIELVKSAECRTQAVCATKMLICPGCGSSISFMEGCRCRYCGGGLRLSDYGWALEKLEMN